MRLFWEIKKKIVRTGANRGKALNLLRTNLQAETAEELWSKYILQLTEAESSFRALKSELSISGLCFTSWSRASRRT